MATIENVEEEVMIPFPDFAGMTTIELTEFIVRSHQKDYDQLTDMLIKALRELEKVLSQIMVFSGSDIRPLCEKSDSLENEIEHLKLELLLKKNVINEEENRLLEEIREQLSWYDIPEPVPINNGRSMLVSRSDEPDVPYLYRQLNCKYITSNAATARRRSTGQMQGFKLTLQMSTPSDCVLMGTKKMQVV